MIQAIFYKEWIKTRWYLLLATLFMIGITGYSMLRIGRTIAIQGIDHLWVVMVQLLRSKILSKAAFPVPVVPFSSFEEEHEIIAVIAMNIHKKEKIFFIVTSL